MRQKYRKHLAEILIDVGMVDPAVMSALLSEHRQTKKTLSAIIINHGLTTMKLISYVMEQEYEFKHIDMERYVVPSKIARDFTQLYDNTGEGLALELFPIPKKDFDIKKWIADAADKYKEDTSFEERKPPTILTIVTEDDFYNYVTDSRKVCMMCLNPLIIENADSCYRLTKLSEKQGEDDAGIAN